MPNPNVTSPVFLRHPVVSVLVLPIPLLVNIGILIASTFPSIVNSPGSLVVDFPCSSLNHRLSLVVHLYHSLTSNLVFSLGVLRYGSASERIMLREALY